MSVVLPVGVGVVVGVVLVGNLLQWLLHHYRKATLGASDWLAVGIDRRVVAISKSAAATGGDTIKGQIVTVDSIAEIEPKILANHAFPAQRPAVGRFAGHFGAQDLPPRWGSPESVGMIYS